MAIPNKNPLASDCVEGYFSLHITEETTSVEVLKHFSAVFRYLKKKDVPANELYNLAEELKTSVIQQETSHHSANDEEFTDDYPSSTSYV